MKNSVRSLGIVGMAILLIVSASINVVPGKAAQAPARMSSGIEAVSGPTANSRVVTSYTSPLGVNGETPAVTRRYWDAATAGATIFQLGDQQEVLPGAADQVRVIVQMRGEPLSSLILRTVPNGREISADEAMQFRAYQGQLAQAQQQMFSSLTQQGIGFKVEHQYTYLINAAALTIQQSDWTKLQHTPGVVAIYRDYKAKVNLQESVPLIGAPTVWNMTDPGGQHVTGKGLRVAIIDTGIDYNHSDLGGCFGSGCKVIDGYDFVNLDADPMDDFGHGTHVAGIVAANGTIKGVAPDAELLAYKVCDMYGGCDYSAIIAGLERAADPDQNPLTNDAVDVANLSLGGPGDPTDILSQAVDAATANGIVVVVAAGNAGPGYQTIGSPGAARTAITVAASNKTDFIADFSSRGPIPGFYDDMKPDITAPGVDIYSTVPTSGFLSDPSGYMRLNGTSMATPHVAGSAALLLQLHPTWTPLMVKDTLMNTAVDLGQSANLQGAGRLNVAKAAVSPVMIDPPSIGFGLDDVSQSTWTVNSSVTITNKSAASKNYSLSTSNTFPNGATVNMSPRTFSVSAGQSQTVNVTLSVNNSIVPNASTEPFTYEDNIIVTSGAENWNVPLMFVKSPMAMFVFDQAPWIFYIFNQQGYSQFIVDPPNNLTTLLPEGTYDIIALYNPVDTMVIKEGVSVPAGMVTIPFNKTDAVHNITIDSRDENDQPVLAPIGLEAVTHKSSGFYLSIAHLGGFPNSQHFSSFSSNFALAWSTTTSTNLKSYDYNGLLMDGLSGDLTFTNTPAQLKHVVMKYNAPPSVTQTSILHWVSQGPRGGFSTAAYDYGTPLTAPFERDGYILPRADNSIYSLGYFYEDLVSPPFTQANNVLLTETPYLIAADLNTLEGYSFGRSAPVLTTRGLVVPFNLTPPHWTGKFENEAGNVRLKTALGAWNYLYLNQSQDFSPYPDLAYTLSSQSGSVISQGILDWNSWNGACSNEYMVSCVTWSLPSAGAYTLTVLSAPYSIGGMQGVAQTKLDFNTLLSDPNPPALYALNILEDGQPTDVITPNASNAALTFEVGDDESGLSSVTAEILVNGVWQSLTLQSSGLPYGTAYTAALPPIPADSFVAMRIIAVDTFANRLTYNFWLSGLGVMSSVRAGTNPTGASSVNFTVTFSNDVTGVDISDFSLTTSGVSGATVSGVSGSGSVYIVSINTGANNGTIQLNVFDDGTIFDLSGHPLGGAGAGNGAFNGGETYTITRVSPSLMSPLNAEHLHIKRPAFDWSDFTGASSYQLQVSKSSNFGTIVLNKSLTASSYNTTSDLASNTLFYWRVRARVGAAYTPWSDVFTFTTGNPPSTPTLSAPANGAFVVGTSQLFDWKNSTVPSGTTFDHYQIQIATDPAFTDEVHDNDIAGVANSQDATAVLATGAAYYWRVRSFNTDGDYSAWSAVRLVKIKYDVPVLLSPANGTTVGSLLPTFTWTGVSGAVSYTIEVSKTTSFFSKVINVTTASPNFTATTNLAARTKYYWRVKVNGPYGPVVSLVFSFTTP